MKTLKTGFVGVLIGLSGIFVSCELFEDANNPLTEGEVVQGLKEALDIGLSNSVTSASSVDGYLKNEIIKILLPSEVADLQAKIETESIGGIVPLSVVYDAYVEIENDGNDLFEELITAMNKGAENAASKALPIFGNAIVTMSITDAFDILNGHETAATDYFFQNTSQQLFTAFNPDVKSALDATGANQIYTTTAEFLNYEYDPTGLGLSTVSPSDVLNVELPNSIDEYATTKAIDGLFFLIGEEEKKIREDPFAWGSAIIERVFGSN
ncbi:Protein of unknown function [Ekhidna lutea]|uniref:DUF4197 domain-containing protein n=1 Tax=Ekhidna lutea TaxID=447679 RepID=A0A239JMA4_EKHLU|nr:DUF4197 domain-containing protein [Ekhidna lutea]SNT06965.1 Protein of unknown function [Ekhidna lutea]